MLVGGTGRALREGDQEPGFACHRAVKVSQGLKSPWGQEMQDFSPLWHVLMPGIFQLLVLKVRALLNDFRADSVTRRVRRHHSPGSVLPVCLFWAQRGCFIGCQQPAVPLRAPVAPVMCHGSCCCCSLRAWLSSLGSRSHRPGLQPAAAARSLARGDYGTDSHQGVALLRCLLGILGFFSTTASVTVTPEWLRSGSECRDERQILK